MYRDELEAQRARLATLEAELAQAKQRRRELEARAAAARQARHQARLASQGRRPGRGLRGLVVVLALAIAATLLLGISWIQRQHRASASARWQVRELEQRSREVKARIAAARAELTHELGRCTPPDPR